MSHSDSFGNVAIKRVSVLLLLPVEMQISGRRWKGSGKRQGNELGREEVNAGSTSVH